MESRAEKHRAHQAPGEFTTRLERKLEGVLQQLEASEVYPLIYAADTDPRLTAVNDARDDEQDGELDAARKPQAFPERRGVHAGG